jgi:hypothetical protein
MLSTSSWCFNKYTYYLEHDAKLTTKLTFVKPKGEKGLRRPKLRSMDDLEEA